MTTVLEPSRCTEHNLGSIAQIPPGEGREFSIHGNQIAVFRSRTGEVYATQPLCPHRQGPLSDGLLGGNILVCPFHSWKFDLANGAAVSGDCGLFTYPVRLNESGQVILTILHEAQPPAKTEE